MEALATHGVAPNIGSFLGGGTLRQYACGMRMGRATPNELTTMRRVMAEAMDDRAFGVAYALIYPPDSFADTDEIVAVCDVVAETVASTSRTCARRPSSWSRRSARRLRSGGGRSCRSRSIT